jgi:hypothetical protein
MLFLAMAGLAVKCTAAWSMKRGVSRTPGTAHEESDIWRDCLDNVGFKFLEHLRCAVVLFDLFTTWQPVLAENSTCVQCQLLGSTKVHVGCLDTAIASSSRRAGVSTAFQAADLYTLPSLDAKYNTCLLQSYVVLNSSMDLWANAKYPDLQRLIVEADRARQQAILRWHSEA